MRLLVTALMVVMIAGFIVLVTVIVMRFPRPAAVPAPVPPLPEAITLPAGAEARAVTFGAGWVAVVTADQRILVFDAPAGTLRREVAIGGESE